jgi:FkbM family methyltransferase
MFLTAPRVAERPAETGTAIRAQKIEPGRKAHADEKAREILRHKMLMLKFLKRMLARGLRTVWQLRGGRRLDLFGCQLVLSPHTDFQIRTALDLPRGRSTSRIVRYADFVQLHAVARFLEEVDHPPTVIEVGAFEGVYAVLLGLLLRRWHGSATMVAAEPDQANLRVLRRNLALNGLTDLVTIEGAALLDKPGKCDLVTAGSQTMVASSPSRGEHGVPVTTLGRLMGEHGIQHLDLLLVDVEGAELPVLRGYPWEKGPPTMLLCELHPYAWERYGYGSREFASFLEEHDLRCVDMYLRDLRTFEPSEYVGPAIFLPTGTAGA